MQEPPRQEPPGPSRSPEPPERPHDGGFEAARLEEDHGPGGSFPSWRWLYAIVLAYTVLLVAVLQWFTVTFDHSAP